MAGWLPGNIALALGAATFWGVGDFSGGMGVKRSGGSTVSAVRVITLSHCASLVVLVLIARLRADPFPTGAPLAYGFGAGVAAACSLTAFYIALSRGAMGTAAAVSGLLAASIPALVSVAIEGSPGLQKGLGFIVAGIAIWLIAGARTHGKSSTLWLAIGAGAGFGVYFVLLKLSDASGPFWAMATARMGSIASCCLLLLLMRATPAVRLNRGILGWVLATAVFDTTGNLLFVAATRAGRLDVAAVLASLYPASTILLAAWLLRERPTARQAWGMAVAAGAVLLIAG